MSDIFISAGQVFNGATVGASDFVQVLSGGSASGNTINGGQLQILAGATASATLVNSGFLLVTGGAAANTTVRNSGFDIVAGGTDIGTNVASGGFLIVQSGGTATGAVVSSGSFALLSSGAINNATLQPGASLIVPAGGTATGTVIQPGATLDLATLAFAAGGSSGFNAATGVLSVTEGGRSAAVQLGGSYAGESFTLSDDGGGNPARPGPHGTLITVLSSGGFDDVAHNTTITGAIPDAQTIANYAHLLIASAGVGGPGPAVFSATLDQAGDKVIYSTIGAPRTVLSAGGTGQSVIAAGSGADTVVVTNGTDLIATGSGTNTVTLAGGYNTLDSEGNDTVSVGMGGDTIRVSANAVIYGGNATLSVFLSPNAQLALHTGSASVQVQGGFGSGAFSGGTNGNNLLVAGTGPTTLYAGGAGDVLLASGGSTTIMYGWGGNETMLGQYSQGTDSFNFNGANVTAVGGAGQNLFNIGSGANNIVAGSWHRAVQRHQRFGRRRDVHRRVRHRARPHPPGGLRRGRGGPCAGHRHDLPGRRNPAPAGWHHARLRRGDGADAGVVRVMPALLPGAVYDPLASPRHKVATGGRDAAGGIL